MTYFYSVELNSQRSNLLSLEFTNGRKPGRVLALGPENNILEEFYSKVDRVDRKLPTLQEVHELCTSILIFPPVDLYFYGSPYGDIVVAQLNLIFSAFFGENGRIKVHTLDQPNVIGDRVTFPMNSNLYQTYGLYSVNRHNTSNTFRTNPPHSRYGISHE